MKELLGSLELDRLYQGDCLELMKLIPDKSINAIICDPPYGTTNRNKWDVIIPFDKLWEQYNRIIKDNGAILLFADEPFTSQLIMSNPKLFKQRITWDKDRGAGFLNAKKMLLKQTEDIVLFYKKMPTYNPQMVKAKLGNIRDRGRENGKSTESMNYGKVRKVSSEEGRDESLRYPTNLVKFSSVTGECNAVNRVHPTQKPIELCEWLIKTYTNEGDLILDNCAGSGSTLVAAQINDRKWLGFETESEYIELANKRLDSINLEDDIDKLK